MDQIFQSEPTKIVNSTQVNNTEKFPRISLTITGIVLYALYALVMLIVAIFLALFLETLTNKNAKELLNTYYWLIFKSILVAIFALLISCFYYRSWMKWILIFLAIAPILFGITYIIFFLQVFNEQAELNKQNNYGIHNNGTSNQ